MPMRRYILKLPNSVPYNTYKLLYLQDCIYIYRGVSVNPVGRDVSMAWLSDSYDEIVDSLGEAGSNAGGGGFARLASTIIGKLICNYVQSIFEMT